MDYYLVPGAEWSLIKKGEVVQILGKAKDNGWYRCMALRDSKVKLDRTPFSFMIRSMISQPASGQKGEGQQEGAGLSGITPEMIEEVRREEEEEEEAALSSKKELPPEVVHNCSSHCTYRE